MVDLPQAYQPLLSELVTVNTHLVLYHYGRLPFGVASVPAIFQRTMEQLLNSLTGVRCYLDDIIITGTSTEEHLNNLSRVLERLQGKGFSPQEGQVSLLAVLGKVSGPCH